jgi:hypothetical protein
VFFIQGLWIHRRTSPPALKSQAGIIKCVENALSVSSMNLLSAGFAVSAWYFNARRGLTLA